MSIIIALRLALSVIFIITGGAVFTEWGKRNRGLATLAAVIALIGSFYLGKGLYQDLFLSNATKSNGQDSPALERVSEVSDFIADILGRSDAESRTITFENLTQSTPYVVWSNRVKSIVVSPFKDQLPFTPTVIAGRVSLRFKNLLDVQDNEGKPSSWEILGWARHPNYGPNMVSLYRKAPINSEMSNLIGEQIHASLISYGFAVNRSIECPSGQKGKILTLSRAGKSAVLVLRNEPSRLGVSKSIHLILSPSTKTFFVLPLDGRMRSFEDFLAYEAGFLNCIVGTFELTQGLSTRELLATKKLSRDEYSSEAIFRPTKIFVGRPDSGLGKPEFEYRNNEVLRDFRNEYFDRLREKIDYENRNNGNSGIAGLDAFVGQWGCDNPHFSLSIERTKTGLLMRINEGEATEFVEVGEYGAWTVGYSASPSLAAVVFGAHTIKRGQIYGITLGETYAWSAQRC